MAISLGILTQHFQTNPHVSKTWQRVRVEANTCNSTHTCHLPPLRQWFTGWSNPESWGNGDCLMEYKSWTNEQLLYRVVFMKSSLATEYFLHRATFTQRFFCTDQVLHKRPFYTKQCFTYIEQFLHKDKLLHTILHRATLTRRADMMFPR